MRLADLDRIVGGHTNEFPRISRVLAQLATGYEMAARMQLAADLDRLGESFWSIAEVALGDISALRATQVDDVQLVVELFTASGSMPHDASFSDFEDVAEKFYDQPVYPALEHLMYLSPVGAERWRQVEGLMDVAPLAESGTLADLGVGPAVILTQALSRLPRWSGVGFDVSSHCVRYAERMIERYEMGARAKSVQVDARNIDDKAKFDLVIATEIIEHVPDPQKLISTVATMLRPGGELIASAPTNLPWGPHLSVFETVDEVRALFAEQFDEVDVQSVAFGPTSTLVFGRFKLR